MTHAVQVDEETLRASLEADAAIPPPPPPDPGAASSGPPDEPLISNPDAWLTEARLLASFMAHKITPGWGVAPDVQEKWAGSLALCLDRLMPGGLGGVDGWGPWGKLAYASAAWALCGFDMEKFKFKSLYPNQQKPPIEGESSPAADQAPPGTATPGGFKTSG